MCSNRWIPIYPKPSNLMLSTYQMLYSLSCLLAFSSIRPLLTCSETMDNNFFLTYPVKNNDCGVRPLFSRHSARHAVRQVSSQGCSKTAQGNLLFGTPFWGLDIHIYICRNNHLNTWLCPLRDFNILDLLSSHILVKYTDN